MEDMIANLATAAVCCTVLLQKNNAMEGMLSTLDVILLGYDILDIQHFAIFKIFFPGWQNVDIYYIIESILGSP